MIQIGTIIATAVLLCAIGVFILCLIRQSAMMDELQREIAQTIADINAERQERQKVDNMIMNKVSERCNFLQREIDRNERRREEDNLNIRKTTRR